MRMRMRMRMRMKMKMRMRMRMRMRENQRLTVCASRPRERGALPRKSSAPWAARREAPTESSHGFNSQKFESRVSNPRTNADVHFKMAFESSNLPGAGPIFQIELLKTGHMNEKHLRSVLMTSIRKMLNRGYQIPNPDRQSYVSNRGTFLVVQPLRVHQDTCAVRARKSANTVSANMISVPTWILPPWFRFSRRIARFAPSKRKGRYAIRES